MVVSLWVCRVEDKRLGCRRRRWHSHSNMAQHLRACLVRDALEVLTNREPRICGIVSFRPPNTSSSSFFVFVILIRFQFSPDHLHVRSRKFIWVNHHALSCTSIAPTSLRVWTAPPAGTSTLETLLPSISWIDAHARSTTQRSSLNATTLRIQAEVRAQIQCFLRIYSASWVFASRGLR